MDKFSKGDYIHTIPLQCVLVKRRIRDESNKTWYKVSIPNGDIFWVSRTLTKGPASKEEVSQFKQRAQKYENK